MVSLVGPRHYVSPADPESRRDRLSEVIAAGKAGRSDARNSLIR